MPPGAASTPVRPPSKNCPTNTSSNGRLTRTTNENAPPLHATSALSQKGVHRTLTTGPATPVAARRAALQPNTVATNVPPAGIDWTGVLERMNLLESQLAQANVTGFGVTPPEQPPVVNQVAAQPSQVAPEQHPVNEDMAEQLQQTQASLAAAMQSNAVLREQLEAAQASQQAAGLNNVEDGSIPRPKGTFSIQVEMGLATSRNKCDIYNGTLRYLRDLAIRSGMNWELPWAEIPSEEKVKVYRIARNHHSYLRKYHNDWATEEIIKQFFKNKRKNHYRNGWLTVPDRYRHLSDVSSKRNPNASRTKKAKKVLAQAQARKARAVARAKSQPAGGENEEEEEEEEEGEGVEDNEERAGGNEQELDADNDDDLYA